MYKGVVLAAGCAVAASDALAWLVLTVLADVAVRVGRDLAGSIYVLNVVVARHDASCHFLCN